MALCNDLAIQFRRSREPEAMAAGLLELLGRTCCGCRGLLKPFTLGDDVAERIWIEQA
jgi:hypothetical protein